MSELTGKVAIITGSTSGIGLEIAKTFAKAHAHVVINGFGSQKVIEDIMDHLKTLGSGSVIFCPADLTKEADIEKLIHSATENLGSIDILINNAGVQYVSPIEEFPTEKWDQVLALNLTAVFHTIKRALPFMRKKNFGRIINIASTQGVIASIEKSAYVAAKHGIIGLTKVVALETAKENITCNAVCPGFMLTPLVDAQIRAKMQESGRSFAEESEIFVSGKHPSGKFVSTHEVAQMCLLLANPGHSEIRGAQMIIDGGWTVP